MFLALWMCRWLYCKQTAFGRSHFVLIADVVGVCLSDITVVTALQFFIVNLELWITVTLHSLRVLVSSCVLFVDGRF